MCTQNYDCCKISINIQHFRFCSFFYVDNGDVDELTFVRKRWYFDRISYLHYLPMPLEPTHQGLLHLIIACLFIEKARSRRSVLA